MEMTQKTLPGMQMAKKLMDYSDILLILPNGRQLIVCIQILGTSQETYGSVLLQTERILLVT